MSFTNHHITSHSTGFSILARVLTQSFSNFQSIHVTLCVCSFRMAVLFQNVRLRDPLKVWDSQGSRFTVTMFPIRLKMGLCADAWCLQGAPFVIILLVSNLLFSYAFCFNQSHQWWFRVVGLPATTVYGKFQRGCLRKAFMKSGDMARSCRGRLSIGNLQDHTPCILHCVPSRASCRPTAYFNIITSVTIVTHFGATPVGVHRSWIPGFASVSFYARTHARTHAWTHTPTNLLVYI